MLTLFSTPKPFRGHIGIIQRNAIRSWQRIHPDVEIILFGDEEGASETSRELGLRHVPEVPTNEFGTKLLRGFFEPAQQMTRHNLVCYINCDIMLLPSFAVAVIRVASRFQRFLMVGQRWNTDILEPWDFESPDWDGSLDRYVQERGSLLDATGIDYFVFPRGLYYDMPPLVIGRIWWDHWLIWRARSLGTPVVDATRAVRAIHQNHDYSYHPAGAQGVWHDAQAQRNYEIAGGKWHLYTIEDSTHALEPDGIERKLWYRWAPILRAARPYVMPVWHKLLTWTRPVRHSLGIRRET